MGRRHGPKAMPEKKLTPRQFVLRHYPHAGAQLSAMRGWQIIDYGEDSRGSEVIARSSKSESAAWFNASAVCRRAEAS